MALSVPPLQTPLADTARPVAAPPWAQWFTGIYDENSAILAAIAALSTVPTGTIAAFGGTAAPATWALCRGAAVSRTAATYAPLYAVIGTTYGVGDGSTTYNLPDLQQRVPLGKAAAGTGATLGATGGAIDHTHTGPSHSHTGPSHTHAGPSHSHAVTVGDESAHTHGFSATTDGSSATADVDGAARVAAADGHTHGVSGTTGAGSAHGHSASSAADGTGATGASGTGATGSDGTGATGTNNPPYQVVNYIIKL